jgi:hypothetical protein
LPRSLSIALLAATLGLGVTACKKGDEPGPAGETPASETSGGAAAEAQRPAGPTGTVRGVVKFAGEAPEMPRLLRGADPECAKKEMTAETVLVNDNGTLRDVLVRVKPGAVPGWIPSQPVVIDQIDCMYRPRVQGGVIGQKLEVSNSDQTTHNVHVRSLKLGKRQGHDTVFNRAQPAGVGPIHAVIEEDEIYKLKCDQHGWMQGYIVLSDNPYASVSDQGGAFTIDQAPVGTYELEAWHAFYGVKTAEVTVEEGKTAEVEFSFDAAADNPNN